MNSLAKSAKSMFKNIIVYYSFMSAILVNIVTAQENQENMSSQEIFVKKCKEEVTKRKPLLYYVNYLAQCSVIEKNSDSKKMLNNILWDVVKNNEFHSYNDLEYLVMLGADINSLEGHNGYQTPLDFVVDQALHIDGEKEEEHKIDFNGQSFPQRFVKRLLNVEKMLSLGADFKLAKKNKMYLMLFESWIPLERSGDLISVSDFYGEEYLSALAAMVIDSSIDINFQDEERGNTFFMNFFAYSNSNILLSKTMTKYLIAKAGNKLNIKNIDGYNALTYGLRNCIEVINHQKPVDLCNGHLSDELVLLIHAGATFDKKLIQLEWDHSLVFLDQEYLNLLEVADEVSYKPDSHGRLGLTNAVIKRNHIIVDLFIDRKVNVNHRDFSGKSALTYAVQLNDFEAVKKLVVAQVDINLQDELGRTALMYAAMLGNVEIALFLIDNGAHLDWQDDTGKTAHDLAISRNQDEMADLLEIINPGTPAFFY
jgi:hypothetical protein